MKKPNSAVRGMRKALDQAQYFQLVHDPAQRDCLDIEQFRQLALMNTLVLGEMYQYLPLRPRQPGAPGVLLEPSFEKSGHVVEHEAQRGGVIFHGNLIISKLMISFLLNASRASAGYRLHASPAFSA